MFSHKGAFMNRDVSFGAGAHQRPWPGLIQGRDRSKVGGEESLGILKVRDWPTPIKIEVPILQLFILVTWYKIEREPINLYSLFQHFEKLS